MVSTHIQANRNRSRHVVIKNETQPRSLRYVTKGAESEQPVGALCYQWVGCRDHAGITGFPHSESWQAQGGPAYICRDQRKHVFYDMRPLNKWYICCIDVHTF